MQLPQAAEQEPGSWGKSPQQTGAKAMPHADESSGQKRQGSGAGETSLHCDPY